jgi:DNA topoisomerase I
MAVVDSLEKSAPKILSAEMTREFEREMDGITGGAEKRRAVIDRAKAFLVETLEGYRAHELEVGQELLKGLQVTQREREELGPCNLCGKQLKIIFNPRTRKKFVGCSGYPECKNAFPLASGLIEPTEKLCEFCKTPIIKVVRAGKRPFLMCLKPDCESKKDWKRKGAPAVEAQIQSGEEKAKESANPPEPAPPA